MVIFVRFACSITLCQIFPTWVSVPTDARRAWQGNDIPPFFFFVPSFSSCLPISGAPQELFFSLSLFSAGIYYRDDLHFLGPVPQNDNRHRPDLAPRVFPQPLTRSSSNPLPSLSLLTVLRWFRVSLIPSLPARYYPPYSRYSLFYRIYSHPGLLVLRLLPPWDLFFSLS